MQTYKHQNLWQGCVGAWCPSQDRSKSTLLTDFSGYNSHGTLTNMDPGTDWVASGGKIALDFDGVNDRTDCAASNEPNGATALTISAWFYARSLGSNGFGRIVTRNDQASFALLAGSATALDFSISATTRSCTVGTLVNDRWNHVCAVWKTDQRFEVWFNGQLTAAATTSGSVATHAGPIVIGNRASGDRGFNGPIDDIRIYTRDLSPSEIYRLGLRRGIAYETARRRSYSVAAPATNPFFFQRQVLSRRSA